jgi:hypothetical protein
MNKKQFTEFIPLTIFLLSGIGTIFKIPASTWLVALSGFFLASLYFYFAFWLYVDYGISLINRLIAGLAFSEFMVTTMFGFLHWPGWDLFTVISLALLAALIMICLFNNKSSGYKQLLYRSVVFVAILTSVYCYRRFNLI